MRDSLTRFGTNILYPRHVLANLFQGKLAGAGDETLRFVLNTTVGLLGFFDPATEWDTKPSREDFGQVLVSPLEHSRTFNCTSLPEASTISTGIAVTSFS